jgi:hypothetical protein
MLENKRPRSLGNDNYANGRRNIRMLKVIIFETNSKNNSTSDFYRGINEFKMGHKSGM